MRITKQRFVPAILLFAGKSMIADPARMAALATRASHASELSFLPGLTHLRQQEIVKDMNYRINPIATTNVKATVNSIRLHAYRPLAALNIVSQILSLVIRNAESAAARHRRVNGTNKNAIKVATTVTSHLNTHHLDVWPRGNFAILFT